MPSGQILVHKTLGQVSLQVIDISDRSGSSSAFGIHVIFKQLNYRSRRIRLKNQFLGRGLL
jgi:hypothetical protein